MGYAFLYTRVIYLLDKFCEFCKTFIPLSDSSVRCVRTSYPYPGMEYVLVEIPEVVLWVVYIIPKSGFKAHTRPDVALRTPL